MKDEKRTKRQLLAELAELRQRVAELEEMEAERKQAEEERERLLVTERELRLLAETLAEVSLALTSQSSCPAVLDEILCQAQRIVPYSRANIALLEGDMLRNASWVGYDGSSGEELVSSLERPLDDLPVDAKAVHSRKPVMIPDTRQDPGWVVFDETAWIRSYLVVPICLHDRVLGLLRLDGDIPGRFSAEDAERLQPLASAAAIALENARLYEEAQQELAERKRAEEEVSHRAKQLALINEVGQRIAPILELTQLYQTVVEAVQEKFGYQNVAILLVRDDEVALEAVAGPQAKLMPSGYTQKMGEGMVGWVAQSGETLLANDVTKEPRFFHLDYLDVAAEQDVPIRLGGKTIGVLLVDSDRPNVFTEADVTTLETIADQVARSIQNAHLYEEEQRRAAELAALNEIAMTVTSTLDLQEVLQAIQERIMELLGEPYPPLFFLFNEEDQTFKATPTRLQEQGLKRVEKLVGVNFEELTLPLPALKPALREALLAGKPYLTDDLSDLSELGISRELVRDAQRELEINSIVALPLWVKGKLAGSVVLVSPKETMPEEEIELLSAIANQAAIAIENARLYGERSRKADQLAALYDISLDVVAQLDLEKLLQTIIERATRLLNARGGGIYLYDPAKREIELRAAYGYFTKDYTGTRLGLGEGLSGKVAQSGEPLVVEDYANWGGRSPKYDGEPSIAVLGLPLKRGDELLGVLFINHEVEKGFHEAEIRLATLFANQTAIAIENASLYEQTDKKLQHRVTELTALNAIAESLTSTLELDEILESIVTRVRQVMEARICTIRLVEGDELTIGAAVGYRDESSRQHTINIDERLARIVRDQQPLIVEDLWKAEDIPQSRRERAKREGVHSFLGVPMISKGETIGVLSIYGEKAHHFAQEEERLLSTIANQAALAIERARLHEKVREHAEELEQLVQERTEELMAMQVELLQSAKLAALGQLSAGVAHELNNPLGAISGYLELLQEGVELGPQGIEYMERIEKRIQQAAKIVSELRSLGTPSESAWQTIDINDILEETLALVERRLSLHQIKVQKDITPDLPHIHADPDRLQQVFINLITNARQAMEEGGTLKVTSRESRNGEWVEIFFADTGEGIAKEHLGKIFDPFFTTRSPGEAMGLGLSVSHRHIRDHGGAIDVWSEKRRGTVFRIALPPSGAKRCWEILDCDKKERCKAVRENADYRCWTVMEDLSRCEHCEVYKRKALPRLSGTLLPE